MKLLFCPLCTDVCKLFRGLTWCQCERSCARLLEDEIHAEVGGEGIILGIGNTSFEKAIRAYKGADAEHKFEAFVIADGPGYSHVRRTKGQVPSFTERT